jgi:TetR/AcrR family transcriptional regulator
MQGRDWPVSIRRGLRPVGERSATKDQLLDAAGALMIERDTVEVSISDIAGRAGVNSALISYYFKGKQGLLIALARRAAAVALTELDALMAADLSPTEKMRKHLAGIINTFFLYPYLNRLLWALARDASSEGAHDMTSFFAKPVADAQRRLILAGVTAGEFRPVDPMLFHFAAFGACEYLFAGTTMLRLVFGVGGVDDSLRRQYVETVTDMLMNGYLTADNKSARAAPSRAITT